MPRDARTLVGPLGGATNGSATSRSNTLTFPFALRRGRRPLSFVACHVSDCWLSILFHWIEKGQDASWVSSF
jgi:hypothetical protein